MSSVPRKSVRRVSGDNDRKSSVPGRKDGRAMHCGACIHRLHLRVVGVGAFTGTFEMGIDAMFVCYIEDSERRMTENPLHSKKRLTMSKCSKWR
jgi:hypothetical protein